MLLSMPSTGKPMPSKNSAASDPISPALPVTRTLTVERVYGLALTSRVQVPDSPAVRVAVTVEQCWHRVPGGSAVATLELLRALVDHGGAELVGVAAYHASLPQEPWRPPIPILRLPLPRLALYETWHALRWPTVERTTGPVDLVHATAVAVPAAHAPLVVTVHDLAFLHDPDQPTRHGLRFFRRGLELTRRHARVVLCPSDATRADCEAAGIEADRIRVVPWGVRSSGVDGEAVAKARRRFGLNRPYVLFAGTVEPRKNLPRLVAAFGSLVLDGTDVDLALAGPAGWNEDLDRLVAGRGDRVKPLGFVPRRDLSALYRGASAVCYPSLREGFGLPVLEAMAEGAPVITSKGTATEEVAGDAALLVDPTDEDAIAEAIATVVADEALARRLGEAGRARAALFTWERTAALTVKAYAEAAR
jgi:glycosyltransferase involved in cell wall biosynthesis